MTIHQNAFAMSTTSSAPMAAPLASKAMLINLTIRAWAGRKIDKGATHKVVAEAHAKADSARVTKSLVSKSALAEIERIASEARGLFHARTLPWKDNGQRIISATGYIDFMLKIDVLRARFDQAVQTLRAAFPDYVAQAEIDLGALFDAADYPDANAVASRFAFPKPLPSPLPSGADFRVDIGKAALEQARADIDADVKAMVADAMRNAFERVLESVGAMADKLAAFKPAKGKGDKSEGIFRDSLVSNVAELASLLPSLNLTGDPRLDAIAQRMVELSEFEADTLRQHGDCRAVIQRKAAAIVADVSAFMA